VPGPPLVVGRRLAAVSGRLEGRDEMNAGEKIRFECNVCHVVFDVTYEPHHKGNPEVSDDEQTVDFCPFCGEENVTEQ